MMVTGLRADRTRSSMGTASWRAPTLRGPRRPRTAPWRRAAWLKGIWRGSAATATGERLAHPGPRCVIQSVGGHRGAERKKEGKSYALGRELRQGMVCCCRGAQGFSTEPLEVVSYPEG